VLAGWGVSVLPELLVRDHLQSGRLINIAPGHAHRVELFWHCWNLDSVVLDTLTHTLTAAAAQALNQPAQPPGLALAQR